MIDKNFVKRIMKSITRREVGLSDHQIMHPVREWFFSLAIALIFLVVAVFLCVKLYWYYNSLELGQSSDSDTPIVIYRAEEIEAALTEFASRKKAHDELKASLADNPKIPSTELPIATSTVSLPSSIPLEIPIETNTQINTPELGVQ